MDIDSIQLRKQSFLADYREVCDKHGMVLVLVESDGAPDYARFAAAETEQDPDALELQITEALDEDLRTLLPMSPRLT